MKSRLIKYFLGHAKSYFAEAEEFVVLSATYRTLTLWTLFDMMFPFILILTRTWPDVFSISGLYKSWTSWVGWFRYRELKQQFAIWKDIADACGGPYISTNNPAYMPYVYADAMQRIQNRTFSNVGRRARRVPA